MSRLIDRINPVKYSSLIHQCQESLVTIKIAVSIRLSIGATSNHQVLIVIILEEKDFMMMFITIIQWENRSITG